MSRFGNIGHRLYTGEVSYDFIGHRRRWYIISATLIAISLIALAVCVIALFEVGWFATTAVFLVLSLIALLAAQVLAGVQYVRAEGPPGTVPAHLKVNG